jgi:hypothetical protein
MTVLQLRRLRTGFNGRLEGAQTLMITARVFVAAAFMAVVSWLVWRLVSDLLGGSVPAQIVEVCAAAGVGGWLYMKTVLRMKIPEAFQVEEMLFGRFRRARVR